MPFSKLNSKSGGLFKSGSWIFPFIQQIEKSGSVELLYFSDLSSYHTEAPQKSHCNEKSPKSKYSIKKEFSTINIFHDNYLTKYIDYTCFSNLPSFSDCSNRGLSNNNSVKASSVDDSSGVLSIYSEQEINNKSDFSIVSNIRTIFICYCKRRHINNNCFLTFNFKHST